MTCGNCGATIAPGMYACGKCGVRIAWEGLPQPSQVAYYQPPAQPSMLDSISRGFGLGCGCLLLIPAAILVLVVLAQIGSR